MILIGLVAQSQEDPKNRYGILLDDSDEFLEYIKEQQEWILRVRLDSKFFTFPLMCGKVKNFGYCLCIVTRMDSKDPFGF